MRYGDRDHVVIPGGRPAEVDGDVGGEGDRIGAHRPGEEDQREPRGGEESVVTSRHRSGPYGQTVLLPQKLLPSSLPPLT